MEKVTIYTNEAGQQFTLDDYDRSAGVSHANNITVSKEVDKLTARSMHEKGSLHYVFGIGDRKELTGKMRRNKQYGKFEVK